MGTPIPPWEQEQAAEALAELQRERDLATQEAAALDTTKGDLLLSQVDRLIAERKGELDRMQRLSQGGPIDSRGALLAQLGKPGCILLMIGLITLMVIALQYMATWVQRNLADLAQPAVVEEAPAQPEPAPAELEPSAPAADDQDSAALAF